MTIKWGDPIECNGVRPDWLRDGEPAEIENSPGEWLEWKGCSWHKFIGGLRLPADHPAYIALARGFTPWSGGESAPDDWDATQPVLFRDRFAHTGAAWHWGHCDTDHPRDIIGYRKRVEYGAVDTDGSRSGGQPIHLRGSIIRRSDGSIKVSNCDFENIDFGEFVTALAGLKADTITIAQMTEEQWRAVIMNKSNLAKKSRATNTVISVLGDLGLIRPETTAERFARETGHAVTEAVEAALNWKDTQA